MGVRVSRTAVCLWCGTEFTREAVEVVDRLLYCSATHQNKFQGLRRTTAGRVCPRSDKRKYPTRKVAKVRLRELKAARNTARNLECYRCACGWWHLGRRHAGRPDG